MSNKKHFIEHGTPDGEFVKKIRGTCPAGKCKCDHYRARKSSDGR